MAMVKRMRLRSAEAATLTFLRDRDEGGEQEVRHAGVAQ